MLSGCKGGGGGSASFGGGSGGFDVADAGFDDGYYDTGDGGSDVNPEPTTMAMLGSGLLAYGFIRRKRKK